MKTRGNQFSKLEKKKKSFSKALSPSFHWKIEYIIVWNKWKRKLKQRTKEKRTKNFSSIKLTLHNHDVSNGLKLIQNYKIINGSKLKIKLEDKILQQTNQRIFFKLSFSPLPTDKSFIQLEKNSYQSQLRKWRGEKRR